MTDTVEVVSGVRVHVYDLDAEFACGSLTELARGLRDALWSDLNLYAATDTLIVRVGGDRPDSQERALEVESWQPGVPYETIRISYSILQRLKVVRKANMPGSEYARWACDCDEYCDEDHGEGRIDLYVFKPSFHELAASQADRLPNNQ
jgi:hypothetical protein